MRRIAQGGKFFAQTGQRARRADTRELPADAEGVNLSLGNRYPQVMPVAG
jgi:hypothetical protein